MLMIVQLKYLHSRRERTKNVETGENDKGQKEGIVVENGEGGGFIVGNLIFLPQDPIDKSIQIPGKNTICIICVCTICMT